MSIEEWFHRITGGESQRTVAQKIDIQQSKLSRQIKSGHLDPEIIRDIAREYGVKAGDALLETGFLNPDDLTLIGVEQALRIAKNSEILAELDHRVDPDERRTYRGEGVDGAVDLAGDAEVFDFPTPGVRPDWQDYAVADSSPDHDEEDTDFD